MKRKFLLSATYGQRSNLDLSVTVSQSEALPVKSRRRETLASIIRANWPVIEETLQSYSCPGHSHAEMWDGDERIAGIKDIETGAELSFTATADDGPRFIHELGASAPVLRR